MELGPAGRLVAWLSTSVPAQSVTLFVIPASGGPVNFDAGLSSDPDGSIVSYDWTFGDGASATGITASHTYAAAGAYTAVHTVRDNLNAPSTASMNIVVSPGATAPPAPSNLTGSVKNTTVTLQWTDNAANESGFYVERAAKTKNLQFTRIATVGASSA